MNKFFLNIYDYLSKHKAFSIALLLVVTALCVFSALRLDYKENIADFLPTDPEKERYTSVYNDLGNQGQITVIFSADTTQLAADEAIDAIMEAMDAFESHWKATDTAQIVSDLQCRVDGSQVFDAIDFIRENQALFLTENDYQRMDSLLANPEHVATSMANIKRMLSMPTAGFVVEGIKADPLNLYSPALQRLNALNPTQNYRLEDEYLFNESGDKGFAFFSSPFSGSDTQGNAKIVDLIDKVTELTESEHPEVKISAVGAPTIAVTNARQIKHDSYLSIALALVLIFGILMFTMARKRNLLWLGIAILFGWIFALAVIALFKSSISIIVVGIGSVIVGIAGHRLGHRGYRGQLSLALPRPHQAGTQQTRGLEGCHSAFGHRQHHHRGCLCLPCFREGRSHARFGSFRCLDFGWNDTFRDGLPAFVCCGAEKDQETLR